MMRMGRRGAYAPMLVLLLLMLLGFGALSLNIVRLGQCRVEVEATAASAARAGLMVLRTGGTTGDADGAIVALAGANTVCGESPSIDAVVWGRWDDTAVTPGFISGSTPANAVTVTLGRSGLGAVDVLLGNFLGVNAVNVRGEATAAIRSRHWVFIVDIQAGMTEAQFLQRHAGLVSAVTTIGASAGPADAVSVIVTSGHYAWELFPLTTIGSAAGLAAVQANLSTLSLASFAGTQVSATDFIDCTVHTGSSEDDFVTPLGGCYPLMPRRYSDEDGTDLVGALDLARAEFLAAAQTPASRAVVVLMHHPYTAVPADAGAGRSVDGYVESRYTEVAGAVPNDVLSAASQAVTSRSALWSESRSSLWVLAFNTSDPSYADLPLGDGWIVDMASPTDSEALMGAIVGASPLGVVQ